MRFGVQPHIHLVARKITLQDPILFH
ncbi:hypothetical protein NC653_000785 [Populus alba x Populus x berolinensis]|uniref:Uncharacterized protein n=1 Tax=Populus alba x Populus x berolinensis TaxID=444605 RepID=A0AAD6RKG1_9ROSI|nr:hypothetical protein NC653_000785 [Populus alba x Populus x berolinensis]